jgi:hypothetical protein
MGIKQKIIQQAEKQSDPYDYKNILSLYFSFGSHAFIFLSGVMPLFSATT